MKREESAFLFPLIGISAAWCPRTAFSKQVALLRLTDLRPESSGGWDDFVSLICFS